MKTYKPMPKLLGYSYSYDEAIRARDLGQLLSMRVETSLICNLKCKYCCNKSGTPLESEISYDKIIDLIKQAKDLGAKSIVVIGGGEPTLYPKFKELVSFISINKLIPVIFTNTTTMTKELAKFLYESNASVITKLDSLSEKIQDDLAGVNGTYNLIQKGLKHLIDAGFTNTSSDSNLRLGASFVVNKSNMGECPEIWEFCRKNKIFPNLEMMIPNGNAADLSSSLLTPEDWKNLKLKLLEIDHENYGYDWDPHLPLCSGCKQVYYNMYVTVKGNVRPCSSIHLERGGINLNVNDMTLKEIINSPVFQKARNINKYLTGKCGSCQHNNKCSGCRAMAFAVGLNSGLCADEALCSEDPSCAFFN
jgi:radical SAM protein with 4Fe4S-binding SPASM domain